MATKSKEIWLKGTPICSGVAIGRPFFFTFMDEVVPEFAIAVDEVEDEVNRYQRALSRSRQDVMRLQRQLEVEGALEGAAILGTHLQIMQDPLITTNIEAQIRETRKNTEFIFQAEIAKYEERFNRISDKFFRERFKDIQDISHRIMGHLRKSVRMSLAEIPRNSVVFASDLVPSDTAEAKSSQVSAFVTEAGGETSHAAIVAKAKGIPYVASIDFRAIDGFKGAQVIVDGRSGDVILNPTRQTLAKYRGFQKRLQDRYKVYIKGGALEPETMDGYSVRLSANIEGPNDLNRLNRYGGHGVGLFRSEYMFLGRDRFPTEEEQFETYTTLVNKLKGKPLVIRTFDVGGDKFGDLEHLEEEMNPFLGCRAIRFMLRERDLFTAQLRAILRASALGPIKIMLPMISGYPELREAKDLIIEVQEQLRSEGADFDENIKVGCMIEVPSAAITCDILAKECDFLSIGTNDLVQYSLAVDRGNQSMSYLYAPTHPGVIRLIRMIVREANRNEIPVSICGEIAADPRFTSLLLGLGVHELSVAPRYIPVVKNAIRMTNIVSSHQLSERVLRMSTAEEIEEAIQTEYHKQVPAISLEEAATLGLNVSATKKETV